LSNRREFLQMSLAASALPAIVAARTENGAASSDKGVGRGHVIVETTSPMALAFGDEAVRLGLEPHGIKDDVTNLWCHTLSLQWKRGPATLAGITLSTSLFCLETLARDYGMRVWFRAIHNYLRGGAFEHFLAGPDSLVLQAAAFGGQWSVGFAGMAAGLPQLDSSKWLEKTLESAARTREPGPMVSWIIAPRPGIQSDLVS
jgi:hypothetical protein